MDLQKQRCNRRRKGGVVFQGDVCFSDLSSDSRGLAGGFYGVVAFLAVCVRGSEIFFLFR